MGEGEQLSRDDYRNGGRAEGAAAQRSRRRSALLLLTIIPAVILLAAIALYFHRGAAGERPFSYSELLMDTEVSVQLFSRKAREAQQVKKALFEEMQRLELLLSYHDPRSEIFEINSAAGERSVAVAPETAEVIQKALHYSAVSEGAFDPTIAPLLDLWGFREGEYRIPGPEELREASEAVDYRLVEDGGGEVYLPRGDMALDLGGIAKGYIIDRGLDLLAHSGVSHALINAGGDIGILGPKADGSPWRVGLKHPRSEKFLAVIPWSERGAIVTSGDYERFFEKNGVRYHHILDPRTGQPASSLISVTVVAPTAVQADALSTALFVLGPQRGLALVEDLPGVEALLVTPQLELLLSSGLRDLVELPGSGQ